MPERVRVVAAEVVAELGVGGLAWSCGEVATDGAAELWPEVEARYVRMITTLDWSRVLLSARALHVRQGHDVDLTGLGVCGRCVEAVLLETRD